MRVRSHNDQTMVGSLFNRRAARSIAVLYSQNRPGSQVKRRAKRPGAVAQSGETGLPLTSGAGLLFNRRARRPGAVAQSGETGLPLIKSGAGSLFKRRAKRPGSVAQSGETGLPLTSGEENARVKNWLAFAGVYLFTLMLYARPNDLFPAIGDFPLVKIVAIAALLIYIGSKAVAGARPSVWTVEMSMLVIIASLGVLLMPVAASPKDSLDTLSERYLKTVVIFILMVNLIDRRQRLFSLWKLVVVCGAVLGVGAI